MGNVFGEVSIKMSIKEPSFRRCGHLSQMSDEFVLLQLPFNSFNNKLLHYAAIIKSPSEVKIPRLKMQ